MTLNLMMSEHQDLKPRITVFGVGGAGGNAVNNMIEQQLEGVEFVVANTDAQALAQSKSTARVQMGIQATEGLGAGARPSVGAAAAEESIETIVDHLAGAHMCFITAGMGGGTGTGAAPIIAQAARELGVLTVGVVTKPFQFEGSKRMRQAEEGLEALQKVVDTLIIIPNQNLFRLANEKTTFTEAFAMADDVLYQGVKGVTDLMVRPGLINLDFADVRAVMDEMGKAMMGTGESEGDDRAVQAAEKAIANPLLDEISLKGAKGVLINITGGYDLTLFELDEAANRIREEVDPDANIIVGSTLDPDMAGTMRVSVVATGIDAVAATEVPVPRRTLAEPLKPTVEAAEATAQQAEQVAPQPAPQQPAVAAERMQPAPQPQSQQYAPASERTLFDAPAARTAAEAPRAQAADDLPPPAYSAPRAPQPDLHVEDEQAYVAPRPRQPGTPSPEALRRLEAAVGKAPAAQRPMAASRPQEPQPQADKPRFGINSLINRMTGHGGDAQHNQPQQQAPRAPAPRAQHSAAQQQPRAEAYDDEQSDAQDRVEIPAFLRRQAN
ncbi:cell division protein FtsZ [Thioclava dalianensis]|uniref:Cell division protein FtsZ n=1 Tax=Thioclava dalianensis TaxID=1185766 RepID=A0A074TKN4_9RHOB|nr:cell division protein FtsZ [Thioclava dalianensis]KEP69568.1 cell division protein FtsZ [Thioclava dalianensis]SFN14642.1 cell division protein FtsZ [Thioclava dalianensis]